MNALITSKADRIIQLLDSLRKTTAPDKAEGEDLAFLKGVRFVGCPLVDALEAAGRVLGATFGDVGDDVDRRRHTGEGAELATLNTALDVLLAELEERLL